MKIAIGFLLGIGFISCSKDGRVAKYEEIIKGSDRIRFLIYEDHEFKLVKEVTENTELTILKKILTRDIKPEQVKKFFPNKKFEIIENNRTIGYLMINDTGNNSFVNFIIDEKDYFGFPLTYSIGMYPN